MPRISGEAFYEVAIAVTKTVETTVIVHIRAGDEAEAKRRALADMARRCEQAVNEYSLQLTGHDFDFVSYECGGVEAATLVEEGKEPVYAPTVDLLSDPTDAEIARAKQQEALPFD